jgi:hypothetical protein
MDCAEGFEGKGNFMLGWLVRRQTAKFEREFDYDMAYARDIYDASPRAFFKFSRISAIAAHRERVPAEAWYAAKITAALAEDCGPCTQLVVTMAEREGVSPATLRSILAADESQMPPDAALGFRFARCVLKRDIAQSEHLRTEVVARWGQKGLVSLALAIAASRVFPTVKYALGHGRACERVRVTGTETEINRQASAV